MNIFLLSFLVLFLILLVIVLVFVVLLLRGPSLSREGLPRAVSSSKSENNIPKILLQVSKDHQPMEVIEALIIHAPEYRYLNLTDDGCIEYLRKHPMKEFPALEDKFHSFKTGAHKADLFRYVFLYQNGGVFIDSDMMIYTSLDNVLGSHDLVTIRGYEFWQCTLFNGFIGTVPGHPILLEALRHAYSTPPEALEKDYYLLVKQFYSIVQRYCQMYPHEKQTIGIYQEKIALRFQNMHTVTMTTHTPPIAFARHYFWNKKIPFLNVLS